MTPDARTPSDLASRSLALHVLTDELAERAGREPACYRLPYRSRGVPNLELCSSCEWGSHDLCVSRLAIPGGWRPVAGCKCLCRYATGADADDYRGEAARSHLGDESPLDPLLSDAELEWPGL